MIALMTDDQEKLRASLLQLKAQLAATTSLDPEHADQLSRAVSDVEAVLDGKAKPSAIQEPVTERLADAAREFEVEHPTLAGTVFSMIEALAQMGI